MKYKMLIIKMVLSMNNEDYLAKTCHYLLAKYRREKGSLTEIRDIEAWANDEGGETDE